MSLLIKGFVCKLSPRFGEFGVLSEVWPVTKLSWSSIGLVSLYLGVFSRFNETYV